MSGRVCRFDSHISECDGFPATIGTLCEIDTQDRTTVNAEVIGFQNQSKSVIEYMTMMPNQRGCACW